MEAKRGAWLVRVPGYPPFPMVGEPCTQLEARNAVRTIWPDAEVEAY